MTAKQSVSDSRDRSNSGSHLEETGEFFSPTVPFDEERKLSERVVHPSPCVKLKMCAAELETDQESIESSEEMESPRSVAKLGLWTPKKIIYVHSQVLRIRKEDSHLGEDMLEGLMPQDKLSGHHHRPASSHMHVMLFSRPILPASPLSGKPAIKTLQ